MKDAIIFWLLGILVIIAFILIIIGIPLWGPAAIGKKAYENYQYNKLMNE